MGFISVMPLLFVSNMNIMILRYRHGLSASLGPALLQSNWFPCASLRIKQKHKAKI